MAPKKKAAAAAKPAGEQPAKKKGAGRPVGAGSGPAAVVAAAVAEGPPAPDGSYPDGLNAEIWLRHKENVDRALADRTLANAKAADALGINTAEDATADTSGAQDPFDKKKAVAALRTRGEYRCGFNFLWLDPVHMPSTKIPATWTSVEDLKSQYITEPNPP